MEQINKLIKDRLIIEENTNNTNTNNLLNTISNDNTTSPINNQPHLVNYIKYSEIIKNPNLHIYSNLNDNPINTYRRQLIVAKILISELQEKNSKTLSEKQQIESQLNEAVNSIKSLHNDYLILTEKFQLVNKNINLEQQNNNIQNIHEENENIIMDLENKIKEIEEEKNVLQVKNEELERKLNNSDELNKMQEEKYK